MILVRQPCISYGGVLNLDAPTLPAEAITDDDGHILWRVWCKHCNNWHFHGPGDGHRLAHCTDPASPYLKQGYNLSLWIDGHIAQ